MKKKWGIIYTVTIVICAASLLLVVYLYWTPGYIGGSPPRHTLALNQTVVDNGWDLTVVAMAKPNLSAPDMTYYLLSENGTTLESGTLASIDGIPSGYNITWVDKDNNDLLSHFDVIFISNTGGTAGKAISGDAFHLRIKDEHVGAVTLK